MTRMFAYFLLLTVSIGLALSIGHRPPQAVRQHRYAPMIRHSTGKASNWAGYVAATDMNVPLKKSVTDVRGTWTVPAAASSGGSDSYSAIWVGIDGNSDNTVEQIGTEQDWASGAPVYYAWFEMYPARGFQLTQFPIQPGDVISAEVQFVPKNKFILSISNLTQNAGFSITRKHSAKRTSAEWIAEAPFFRRVLPLADFGTVTFSGCSATIAGVEGAINDPAWQNDGITMENPATSTTLAQPSVLTGDGTGFTVGWQHP